MAGISANYNDEPFRDIIFISSPLNEGFFHHYPFVTLQHSMQAIAVSFRTSQLQK